MGFVVGVLANWICRMFLSNIGWRELLEALCKIEEYWVL